MPFRDIRVAALAVGEVFLCLISLEECWRIKGFCPAGVRPRPGAYAWKLAPPSPGKSCFYQTQ